MTTKLTGEPIHDDRIGFYIVIYGPCDIEERICSVNDMAVGIQRFAFMFLLVRTDDLSRTGKFGAELFGVLLRVGELSTELLDGCLEICNGFTLIAKNGLGMFKPGSTNN